MEIPAILQILTTEDVTDLRAGIKQMILEAIQAEIDQFTSYEWVLDHDWVQEIAGEVVQEIKDEVKAEMKDKITRQIKKDMKGKKVE